MTAKNGLETLTNITSISGVEYPEIIDPKITSVAIIIVNKEGKVLVFARNGNEDKLGLIAGTREKDETIQEAATRELWEETRLRGLIKETDKPFFIAHPVPGAGGYCATFVVKDFEMVGPYPLENSKVSEGYAFWASPENLVDPSRGAFVQYNKALLKKLGLLKE